MNGGRLATKTSVPTVTPRYFNVGCAGRSPGSQVLITAFPWLKPQWHRGYPHLLTVAGAAQALFCIKTHLFPVSPAMEKP